MQENVINKLLLKNGEIVDPHNDKIYHADILISRDRIEKIGQIAKTEADQVIDLAGQSIAPGFVDLHVHFREPGKEDAETIVSGSRAALAGGFTQVCVMPNTCPAIDNEAEVRAVYQKARDLIVDVYPVAAITKERKGAELVEMMELAQAGAVAFTDDGAPVVNNQIFRNALEYSRITGKPIINHAEDPALKGEGIMHEGVVSTRLGMRGVPALSESLMVFRDIKLAEYTGAKLHVPHISVADSVQYVREAKARGVRVTAEVTPHHFSLTDEYMVNFDANGKMAPPLRTEADRQALIEGLNDGTIDAIATDHAPHVYDTKETSLDQASWGIIGLETAFALAMTNLVHKKLLSLMQVIRALTVRPAQIMALPLPEIKAGEPANLTIFDANEWWVFGPKNIYSKSRNTPFLGSEFTGKVKGVIKKGRFVKI